MALTRPSVKDLIAGTVAALMTIAGWLTLGVLAYVSLGPQAPDFGIPAACTTMVAGGLVVAFASRTLVPTGGLTSATILIFSATVVQLRASGTPGDAAVQMPAVLAVMSVCLVLAGLTQILFGLLRLGTVAKHVPQPVIAGFMNGVAILIFMAQLPTLLGVTGAQWAQGPAVALAQAQPATLAVGICTAVVVWLIAWRFKRAPAALIGLACGCALYAAIHLLLPQVALGPLAGALPTRLSMPDALAPLFSDNAAVDLLARNGELIAATALVLAIVGSLETTLNTLAMGLELDARHDPNRELIVFGAANVVAGVLGGLPIGYVRSRAGALIQNGAATRWGAIFCAVATAVLYLAGGRLIALLPLTVLAGIMLTVAWALVDRWTRNLLARGASGEHSQELWINLALIAVVLVVTLWRGFVSGVLLGVLLALAVFVRAMNRSLVRARFTAAAMPSRRVYPPAQEAFLQPAREQIVVLELEGALFFGNADRVAQHVEELGASTRFVVLDLKHINTLDASSAAVLARLMARQARTGKEVLLAGVTIDNRHGRALRALGSAKELESHWHSDVDYAIEAAEQRLLAQARFEAIGADVALEDCALLRGLDGRQRTHLCALLQRRELDRGELLFRQGERGDCLYVLTRGSITVSSAGGDGHRLLQRYVSFSPGMMLGETAMLDRLGRTADAIADAASTVYALRREALERLQTEDPALTAQLMTNIAQHLSERLRHAAAAWRLAAA